MDVLKKYAVFKGRATISEYWYFVLFNFIVSIILSFISKLIGDKIGIISGIYALGILLPCLGVSIRRIHDIGKSGWMILIGFIPIIGAIWLLVLACMDSNPGNNKYGHNPKDTSSVPPVTPTTTNTPSQSEQNTKTQ